MKNYKVGDIYEGWKDLKAFPDEGREYERRGALFVVVSDNEDDAKAGEIVSLKDDAESCYPFFIANEDNQTCLSWENLAPLPPQKEAIEDAIKDAIKDATKEAIMKPAENLKIRTKNKEENRIVQEILIKMGFGWRHLSIQKPTNLGCHYLRMREASFLTCTSDDSIFKGWELKEISATAFINKYGKQFGILPDGAGTIGGKTLVEMGRNIMREASERLGMDLGSQGEPNRKFKVGDKVRIITGGNGAYGSDGETGVITNKKNSSGGATRDNNTDINIKLERDGVIWKMCEGYELELVEENMAIDIGGQYKYAISRTFKVGDKVRIRAWADMEAKFGLNCDGDINSGDNFIFTRYEKGYCGRVGKVTYLRDNTCNIEFDDKEYHAFGRTEIEYIAKHINAPVKAKRLTKRKGKITINTQLFKRKHLTLNSKVRGLN